MNGQSEPASFISYVIGFALSVACTVIPYYWVVNKAATGQRLLAVIIGLAILQVFIQLSFFLHLGRGPKPLYNIAFFAGTAGIIVLVVGGSLFIMNQLHYNMAAPADISQQLAEGEAISQIEGSKTGACPETKANHQIIISHNTANPQQVTAQLCDTLTITNQDSIERLMAFGPHEAHVPYDGVSEQTLRKGQSLTVTLIQAGQFQIHDHEDSRVRVLFKVNP